MDLNRPDFDEFIHEMCTWPIERIVDEVADDPDLRGYLAATAGNIRNQLDWDKYASDYRKPESDKDWYHLYETSQFLKTWTWETAMKFDEDADRKLIAEWAPSIIRALDQRMRTEKSKKVQERLDREKNEREKKTKSERLERFMKSVPEDFKGASIENLSDRWKKIHDGVEKGESFLIYSAPGAGKTYFSYALGAELLQKGITYLNIRLFKLMQGISNEALRSKYSADEIIDMDYVKTLSVLVIDEADKLTLADTAFRNFSYLIDRRCEEHLITVVFCNASGPEDLVAKLGPSICDRFQSKRWKAHILKIEVEQSMRKKEQTP